MANDLITEISEAMHTALTDRAHATLAKAAAALNDQAKRIEQLENRVRELEGIARQNHREYAYCSLMDKTKGGA